MRSTATSSRNPSKERHKGKIYRCAVIGLGQIGSRYGEDPKRTGVVTHAQNFDAHPQCVLVAGCDPLPNQREHFRKAWPYANVYESVHDLLAHEECDIISICTPHNLRLEVIRTIIAHNVQVIFCEKPLALTLREAQRIQDTLNAMKSPPAFYLNFSRRFDPMHQKISHDIQKNRWGTMQSMDAYYSGSLESNGSHIIDGILLLAGEILSVQAHPSMTFTHEHGVSAILKLKNGTLAHMHHMNGSDYFMYEIDLYFSKARLRITHSGFETQFWIPRQSHHYSGFKALLSRESPYKKGYDRVLERALDEIMKNMTTSHNPSSGIEHGLSVLRVQEALLKSVKSGGKKINV